MEWISTLLEAIGGILNRVFSAINHAFEAASSWLLSLPIGYMGIAPLVLVLIIFWLVRFAVGWGGKLSAETVYSEHPGMVQGDLRSFFILHALIWIPLALAVFIRTEVVQDVILFDPDSFTSQLIFSIPALYISTGFLGFVVWNGVSQSEEVRIEPTTISWRHKISILRFLSYSLAFILFRLFLYITLLNFGNWIRLPIANWEREIRFAGGLKVSGGDGDHFSTPTITIPAHSIDAIGEEEPWYLRLRNMGHLTVFRKGESPVELRYLIKFRQLRHIVGKLSENLANPSRGQQNLQAEVPDDE